MNKPQPKVKKADYQMKIILIGDSGVGKTNILLREIKNQFEPNHKATLGIDFHIKTFEIDNKIIKFMIWDTAGQEKFKSITH